MAAVDPKISSYDGGGAVKETNEYHKKTGTFQWSSYLTDLVVMNHHSARFCYKSNVSIHEIKGIIHFLKA